MTRTLTLSLLARPRRNKIMPTMPIVTAGSNRAKWAVPPNQKQISPYPDGASMSAAMQIDHAPKIFRFKSDTCHCTDCRFQWVDTREVPECPACELAAIAISDIQ